MSVSIIVGEQVTPDVLACVGVGVGRGGGGVGGSRHGRDRFYALSHLEVFYSWIDETDVIWRC